MIYKWYCQIVDKITNWMFKTNTIKATPAYYVADDLFEFMHAGLNNRLGKFDTETGLSEMIYDNNNLQQDGSGFTPDCPQDKTDL